MKIPSSNNCDTCQNKIECFKHASYVPCYDFNYEKAPRNLNALSKIYNKFGFEGEYKPNLFKESCKNTCHICENRHFCILHDWKNMGKYEKESGILIPFNFPMLCSSKIKSIPLRSFHIFQNWTISYYKAAAVFKNNDTLNPIEFLETIKRDTLEYNTPTEPELFKLVDAMIDNMKNDIIPMLEQIKKEKTCR